MPVLPLTDTVEVVTEKLETPSIDNRIYRVIRLPNKLEVLLAHDPDTDRSSACLEVNVGTFSDDDDMPGIAHAVEHLLFMGTRKYPEENEYSQYLATHSGYSNASTGSTYTNYFFEVAAKPANDEEPSASNPSPLYGALDRFAQFFIEPLFLADTLDRELRAVDSENKKNLQNDAWRLNQLDRCLANPKHPYNRFGTGNYHVLKELPEGNGVNIRARFIEFYQKNYSANQMKLVVLGRESVDVLQDWVVEFYSAIPNIDLPQRRWEDEPLYVPEQLGIQIFAKPVFDTRSLSLVFPFLDEEMLFEYQPGHYINHLIGHEGPGSILSYLKNRGWATHLTAGSDDICPGTYNVLDCTIHLTEEGLANYKEVVKVFFQYISVLREKPPPEWIFDEIKLLGDVWFKFQQKSEPWTFTSQISSRMRTPLPREWLLCGGHVLRKFDPELINRGISMLRPDNARITIVAQTLPGHWNEKEKWYGTEYCLEKIPVDFMRELESAAACNPSSGRLDCLHLPRENPFIPTNLKVDMKPTKNPTMAPQIIRDDAVARTWFKRDDTFGVPRANFTANLRSPLAFATTRNYAISRIYTLLVQDAFEGYAYDAELAGLGYELYSGQSGLRVQVFGYNDKLSVLLQQFLATMSNLEIRKERFDIVMERMKLSYKNWKLESPYRQMATYTAMLSATHSFPMDELEAEHSLITMEAVKAFKEELLSSLYFEVLVHGNMQRQDALMLTDMLVNTFKARSLPPAQWPVWRSLIFPPGSNFIFATTHQDPANINNCVQYWLYVCERSNLPLLAKTQLFVQMTHEPAFDTLRTKEQLGYIVQCSGYSCYTTCGFDIIVQSERTPTYLESRIDDFLESMRQRVIDTSDQEFEAHKRSLILKKLEKPRNLDEETQRYWGQIRYGFYHFDIAHKVAAQIKALTKQEMIEYYDRFIDPKSPLRSKLLVALHAKASSDSVSDVARELGTKLSLDDNSVQHIQQLLASCDGDKSAASESITQYVTEKANVTPELACNAISEWTKVAKVATAGASSNGTIRVEVKDLHEFKTGLPVTKGPVPPMAIAEYYDSAVPKL